MIDIQKFIKNQVFELKLWEIEEYFSKINPYIEESKKQIKTKISELEKTLQYEVDEIQQEQIDSDFGSICDEYELTESIVERNFYYSVIIQIYTLVELSFNDLCKYLEYAGHKKVKLADLYGNGVERAINYLKKVCDFEFEDSELKFLKEINIIRNIIAHYNGNLKEITNEKQSRKIGTIVEANNGVSKNNEDFIVISQSYIKNCIAVVRKIFQSLYKK